MLDLVAQVSGKDIQNFSPAKIRRAHDLAHVPMAFTFVHQSAAVKDLRVLREVPAEDHGECPNVTDKVCDEVS